MTYLFKRHLSAPLIFINVVFLLLLSASLSSQAEPKIGKYPTVVGQPVTVFGTAPDADTPPHSANFSLPEDSIEIRSNVYVIADYHASYIRKLENGLVKVIAGNGSNAPSAKTINLDSSDKALPVVALEKFSGGFFSFSTKGAGVNFHKDGTTRFVGRTYTRHGIEYEIEWIKFTQARNGAVIALDATDQRNILLRVTLDSITPIETPAEIAERTVMGFDFCGDALIVSHKIENGRVVFRKYFNGKFIELFEDRNYSNSIKCIGLDDFLYGARWELKRYREGKTEVIAADFVHISAIRLTLDSREFLITDSDKETITRISLTNERQVVATSKAQLLSDPVIKMQRVGSDLLGLTSDGSLIRFKLHSNRLELLLSSNGDGKWGSYLGGHKFTSLRAFAYDKQSKVLYLGSGHGIFALNTVNQKFILLAGSEKEYGRVDGSALKSRFAVVRDLLLHDGQLLVADAWNDMVRKIDLSSGEVSAILGTGKNEFRYRNEKCGNSSAYNLNRPISLAIFANKLMTVNSYSHNIVVSPLKGGLTCSFAGTGNPSKTQYGGGYFDGVQGQGQLSGPRYLKPVKSGLYVADMWNNAIRFITPQGNLHTVYKNDKLGRMMTAIAVVENYIYFSSSDATIKRLEIVQPN